MILLDYAILLCLIITVIYCWKLNNKISELKQSRKELQELIANFDLSLEKAEASIQELKDLSSKTTLQINEKLEKGKLIIDDLSFMTDRAANLADKIERTISYSRNLESPTNISTKPITQSPIEKQYNKDKAVGSHELKKSTIESLLAKIAAVKENNKRTTPSSSEENLFKKNKFYEDV